MRLHSYIACCILFHFRRVLQSGTCIYCLSVNDAANEGQTLSLRAPWKSSLNDTQIVSACGAGGGTRSRASNFCPVSTARCIGFLVHTFWVGSKKVDWCWSFSSKDVIETSLTPIIFPRTSVEPELTYLLSPSHLSFTDAGMDKETSSPLLMEKREG